MKNLIWKWFECDYKVHCENRKLYDQIMTWKKSKPGGVYHIPGERNQYDAIIPEEYVDRVKKLLLKTVTEVQSNPISSIE